MSELLDNKRLRIDHLIHISDEAAPPTAPVCINDLMDSACDCLDLCRDRGVEIGPDIIMIEKAMNERNSARLEKLIAGVEAKLKTFNAVLVPLRRLRCLRRLSGKLSPKLLQKRNSKTAFKLIMPTYLLLRHFLRWHFLQRGAQDHEFLWPRRVPRCRCHHHVPLFLYIQAWCFSTICLRHWKKAPDRRPAWKSHLESNYRRMPSSESFGTPTEVFSRLDPMGNVSLCCHAEWCQLASPERLKRHRDPTRDVTTMQEKLTSMPDLAPVVDWCMACIREKRLNYVNPTFSAMLLAWQSETEKEKDPTSTLLNGRITPKYACEQCAVYWTCYMDYEHQRNAWCTSVHSVHTECS